MQRLRSQLGGNEISVRRPCSQCRFHTGNRAISVQCQQDGARPHEWHTQAQGNATRLAFVHECDMVVQGGITEHCQCNKGTRVGHQKLHRYAFDFLGFPATLLLATRLALGRVFDSTVVGGKRPSSSAKLADSSTML
jgi:hypothetical protein